MSAEPQQRRCMVVGYDGGESGKRAVEWAARRMSDGGTLVIVHACRPLHASVDILSSPQDRLSVGRAKLDELMMDGGEDLAADGVSCEVLDEDPVSALIYAVGRHGADAIVLGCNRHSRLHRAVGVVTSELLARSQVPVISVPTRVPVAVR